MGDKASSAPTSTIGTQASKLGINNRFDILSHLNRLIKIGRSQF